MSRLALQLGAKVHLEGDFFSCPDPHLKEGPAFTAGDSSRPVSIDLKRRTVSGNLSGIGIRTRQTAVASSVSHIEIESIHVLADSTSTTSTNPDLTVGVALYVASAADLGKHKAEPTPALRTAQLSQLSAASASTASYIVPPPDSIPDGPVESTWSDTLDLDCEVRSPLIECSSNCFDSTFTGSLGSFGETQQAYYVNGEKFDSSDPASFCEELASKGTDPGAVVQDVLYAANYEVDQVVFGICEKDLTFEGFDCDVPFFTASPYTCSQVSSGTVSQVVAQIVQGPASDYGGDCPAPPRNEPPKVDHASTSNPSEHINDPGVPGTRQGPSGQAEGDGPRDRNAPTKQVSFDWPRCPPGPCVGKGDPIHLPTGQYYDERLDLGQRVERGDLLWERYYWSQRDFEGQLGKQWRHSFERRLVQTPGEGVLEIDERGNEFRFQEDGSGGYLPAPGHDIRLEAEPGGSLATVYATGRRYLYRPDGQLQAIRDIKGTSLTLTYGANGVLSSIHDDKGRGFDFESDGQRILSVQSTAGSRVEYTYDPQGFLSEVTDTRGKKSTYSYQEDGDLTQITLPTGIRVNVAYDDQNRVSVTSETDPSGRVSMSRVEYPADRVRIFWDPTNARTTYQFDENGRELSWTQPDGQTYRFERDAAGRLTAAFHPGDRVERWIYSGDRLLSYTGLDGRTTLVERDPTTGVPSGNTHADGTITARSFDAEGNLVSYKDEVGRVRTFTYTDSGEVATATAPSGAVTRFLYDANSDLVGVVDGLERTTTIERNSLGLETKRTSPGGKSVRTEYEGQALVKAVTDQLGNRTSFERDDLGRVIATVLSNGARIEQKYVWINGQSRVTEITSPTGGILRTEYDNAGRVIAVVNELGHRTAMLRDVMGRVTDVLFQDGTRIVSTYDSRGLLQKTTDPIGRETQYTYDASDRLVQTTAPDGSTSQVIYDERGRPIRTVAPDGGVTRVQYSPAGEPTVLTDALDRATKLSYGADANLDAVQDPNGRETRFEQDLLDRVTKTITSLGFESRQEYDVDGNLNLRVDAASNSVQILFDPLDRPVEVKNPLGNSVKSTYDSVGNVTRIEDENGHAWLMEYDLAGRKTKEADPNGRSIRFEYDLAGQLTKKTLADGATIEMTYDVMGRCTSRTFKNTSGVTEDTHAFTYDIVGRRVTAENAAVRVHSAYDLMDRETLRTVTFKTDPRTPLVRKLSFTYDSMGRRKSMDDHAGRVARYTYDLAGQLTRLDLESRLKNGRLRTRTYRFSYDSVGNLLATLFPNNVRTRRTYDGDHRLTQILHETVTVANNPDGTVTATPVVTLQKFDYTLDPIGNILRIDELEGKGWRYAYDAASRLVEAHMSEALFQALSAKDDRLTAAEKAALAEDGVEPEPPLPPEEHEVEPPVCRRVTYTYDAAGNRLSENRDGLVISSTFGLANEVLTAGRLRYAYDLRGNQTEKVFPGGQKHLYTYNIADQMTAFSRFKPGRPNRGIPAVTDLLQSYTYSPFGERTGLFKANLTDPTKSRLTHVLWDRGRPVEEFWQPVDQALPMQGKRYLWAMGQLLEQGATKFEGVVSAGAPEFELASSYMQGDASRYAQVDHLGSVRLLTTPAGVMAQKTTWGPWGELLEGGTGSRFGYTGHQREAGSGFHYSVFRYLDARNGRWSQRDPIGFAGGMNRYGYVRGNPVSRGDLLGLREWSLNAVFEYMNTSIESALFGTGRSVEYQGDFDFEERMNYTFSHGSQEDARIAEETFGGAVGEYAALEPLHLVPGRSILNSASQSAARRSINRWESCGAPNRLVVGGGRLSDYPALATGDVSLNISPRTLPHIVGDIADAPIASRSFMGIYVERVTYEAFTGRNSRAIGEMARVLRPGGSLLMETGKDAPVQEIVENLGRAGFSRIQVDTSRGLIIRAILSGE